MPTSREAALEDENQRLRDRLVQREAQNRRDFAAFVDRDECAEMYRRALYRQIKRNDALEVEVERLRMELAARKAATPEEPHG